MNNDNHFLESALRLAALGFWVFQVKPGAKTPLRRGWQNEATRDPDIIRKLWFMNPRCNIGIFTEKFGDNNKALLVVDVDVKNGKDGFAEIKRLEANGFYFSKTYSQRTPSGGMHLVYQVEKAVKQGVDVLGPGLDIRSKGGYILGAGSSLAGVSYADNQGDLQK